MAKPAFQARGDAAHGLRIAGLADRADAAVLDADVGLHHALHGVDDRHVGDHEVGRSACARHLVVHAHAFAQALAPAKDDLVAGGPAQVALDLDEQLGITEADAVARRGAEQADILVREMVAIWEPPVGNDCEWLAFGCQRLSVFGGDERNPRCAASATAFVFWVVAASCLRWGRRPDC